MPKFHPIRFDPGGCFVDGQGITTEQLTRLAPQLEKVRDEVSKTDLKLFAEGNIPAEKQPLDVGFLEMPERLLDAYHTERATSELGHILKTAARLRDQVDRVVFLGVGGSYRAARAIMEACCQPFFNELSRAQRGGRPRLYFDGNNLDNDWTNGLSSFLATDREMPWAIVVVSPSGDELETTISFRHFLRQLDSEFGTERLPDLVVPVTGATGQLSELADAIGCKDRFLVPDGVAGRFSVFSAAGLLPAAILGINVVALLEAAAAMNDHFRNQPAGNNVVLDYVAANHLLETQGGCHVRVLSVWSKSLESAGLWYDQLLAESLGKQEIGALPLTVVNPRDLYTRGQQHQQGRRDTVINNVIVDAWRTEPIAVGKSKWDQDQLDEIADRTIPEIMTAAIRHTKLACGDDLRPTADVHLHAADEIGLGQLFQMLMLATVVEGRLLGINPYGQPVVEKYRKTMNQLLREPVTNRR
jgi:glucose-6-phosphate isomerase